MRPVNLLPPEDLRGPSGPSRTGVLPYVLLVALVLAVGVVTLLVTTNNSITESEDEIAALEARQQSAEQRASALAPYVQFASLEAARRETVTSLAATRFDWSRVMNELAFLTPRDVWLLSLTGSATGGADTASGDDQQAATTSALTTSIAGPSLVISACATSQAAVADYVSDLESIDGVTRVGVENSSRLSEIDPNAGGGGEGGDTEQGGCGPDPRAANFIAVLAFDAAPVPPSAEDAAAVAPAPTEGESTEGEEATGEAGAAPASAEAGG